MSPPRRMFSWLVSQDLRHPIGTPLALALFVLFVMLLIVYGVYVFLA